MEPESSLLYPKKITENSREVSLSGKAFFEISKDKSEPFYVHASTISSKALGTSFKIIDYITSAVVGVHVVSGKVSILN